MTKTHTTIRWSGNVNSLPILSKNVLTAVLFIKSTHLIIRNTTNNNITPRTRVILIVHDRTEEHIFTIQIYLVKRWDDQNN